MTQSDFGGLFLMAILVAPGVILFLVFFISTCMGIVWELRKLLLPLLEPSVSQKPKSLPKRSKSAPRPIEEISFRVTEVIDGDTIRVQEHWGESKPLRLLGIDAPETVHPDRPVEHFGEESSAKATEVMLRRTVNLETDDLQGTYDKYGRLLAYVWLKDGTLVNEWLVRHGYAREQTYQNKPCKYRDQFLAAEAEARRARRGMWAN